MCRQAVCVDVLACVCVCHNSRHREWVLLPCRSCGFVYSEGGRSVFLGLLMDVAELHTVQKRGCISSV